MARIQYGSFREQACVLNLSTISGNITNAKADTYYFYLSFRNDVGYNLPSDTATISVTQGQGIRITLPSDAYRSGENILRYAISVNTVDDASTAKLLLQIDAVDASQTPISLPLNIDLTEDEHLEIEKSVSAFPSGSNLKDGLIRTYTPKSANYRYVAGSSATIDNDLVFAASPSGRWIIHYDGYEVYVDDTLDNIRGCDCPIEELSDSVVTIDYDYALDGSPGKFRRYWIYNDNSADIAVGKQIGITTTNAEEDVSSIYYTLFKTVFEGYFDRTTGTRITTLADNVTNLPYLNTSLEYQARQENLKLNRALEQDQAFILKIYPEFTVDQIASASTKPAYNSEVNVVPFIYSYTGSSTDLGTFTGDAILPGNPSLRRILPDTGLSAKVLAGSGIVKNRIFTDLPEDSVLGLTSNTADQILAINSNGLVYVVTSLSSNEAQRALVSTVSGESHASSFTAESTGDDDPSITVQINYPSSIRSDYADVIAGNSNGTFNVEEIVIYIRKRNISGGSVVETRRFTGNTPTNTTSDSFTFTYSSGSIYAGAIPSTKFGLWNPGTPSITSLTNGLGTDYYFDAAVTLKYNGNSVSDISHALADGCIQEITKTFASIGTTNSLFRLTSNNTPSGSAGEIGDFAVNQFGTLFYKTGSSTWEIQTQTRAPYSTFTGDESLVTPAYSGVFYVRTDSDPNELFISTGTNQGNLTQVAGAGAGATISTSDPSSTPTQQGEIWYNETSELGFIAVDVNSSADWKDLSFNPDRIVTFSGDVVVYNGNVVWN